MGEHYEIIIVGAGPAGLSAGIYSGRAGRKTLILEKGNVGGRAALTNSIINYPGFVEISGKELMEKMKKQAQGFGIEIRRENVKAVSLLVDGKKEIRTRKHTYTADAIIIATGTKTKKLGIPGETEFTGSGVAYCAACDAEFFKDQTVVVVGSGDQAVEESEYIARFASNVILLVIHEEGILDCNRMAAERLQQNAKISIRWNTVVDVIDGEDAVTGVQVRNRKTGEKDYIACEGIFLFVGMEAETKCVKKLFDLQKTEWLKTDEKMSTVVSGVFAAGDVREKLLRQVSTAVGDGAIAVSMADRYLEERKMYQDLLQQSEKEELKLFFWTSEYGSFTDTSSPKDHPIREIEIDVAKNPYLADFFGVHAKDLQQGIQIKYLSQRQFRLKGESDGLFIFGNCNHS